MKISLSLSSVLVPAIVTGHTIMQSFNGLAQGKGIYMPSDDSPIKTSTLSPWRVTAPRFQDLGSVRRNGSLLFLTA
jgi:hypothetical protein